MVDPFRSSLTPQIVEALVYTNDWLRAEQPNFYKDPTTEELELYQALEELERVSVLFLIFKFLIIRFSFCFNF